MTHFAYRGAKKRQTWRDPAFLRGVKNERGYHEEDYEYHLQVSSKISTATFLENLQGGQRPRELWRRI
jgi:hypothetical protein